ncbi:MAG: hypothetical protein AYL33_004490 [Candidatus Bathyarchaeota archaeon B63]|nr:MAG: hypothetical protein AYL33_004490 [Candidatus Bathyarchaeota archaeon B63]
MGLTPNHLSIAGVALGLLSGVTYWLAGMSIAASDPIMGKGYLIAAVLLLIASGFLDALDGALARLYGETTSRGGFLDSLLDRYVDSAVYSGIMLGGLCDLPWGLLALIGSLLTSYARARSEAEDIRMESVGLFERAERILLISAFSLLNIIWANALRWGVIILAFATNFTVLQRAAFFFKKTSSDQAE